jgi:hypothetical protein
MRSPLALVLLAVALSVPAACRKPTPSAPVSPLPPDPAPTPVATDAAVAPSEPAMPPLPPAEVPGPMSFELPGTTSTVTLEQAGKGKAKATTLRFVPVVGALPPVRLAIDATLAVSGQPSAVSPTVWIELGLEVTRVDQAGFDLRATVTAADMVAGAGAEPVTPAERAEIGRTVGAVLSTTVTSAGQWGTIKVDVPLGTSVTRELFDTVAVGLGTSLVLPDRPVKPGAVWSVATPFDLAGVNLVETTRYELIKASATEAVVQGSIAVTGTDQQIFDMGMTIDVSKIGGTGTSTFTAPLAALPLGNATTSTVMTYAAGADTFTSTVTIGKTMTAAAPAAP